jgi:hypothetical protein
MTEVKALFPIGKTQWSKWKDKQKIAFNEAREAGVPFADAVEAANATKSGLLRALEDTLDGLKKVEGMVETAAGVAVALNPAVGVATTLVRAASKKKKV